MKKREIVLYVEPRETRETPVAQTRYTGTMPDRDSIEADSMNKKLLYYIGQAVGNLLALPTRGG
jgi:hypothetical protein